MEGLSDLKNKQNEWRCGWLIGGSFFARVACIPGFLIRKDMHHMDDLLILGYSILKMAKTIIGVSDWPALDRRF